VTATRKLVLSAAIVAAGIGVARLMGGPASRWYAPQLAAAPVNQKVAPVESPPVSDSSGESQPRNVRLVPEYAASNPYEIQNSPTAQSPPPLLPVPHAYDDGTSDNQATVVATGSPMVAAGYTPLARLRDEAPRPLEVERRLPAASENTSNSIHAGVALTASTDAPLGSAQVQATIELPPWPSQDEAIIGGVPAPAQATVAPPPWPSQGDAEHGEPRTHIVVDGDSLERLAARYLDDPRRALEIYQANRELLTSPDLLPIGAELKIPVATRLPAIDPRSPQSFIPRAVAIHTSPTTPGGLVPVRPIPAAFDVMPRAQLGGPLPVP
jgi:nucleoid-associated protein YgaU